MCKMFAEFQYLLLADSDEGDITWTKDTHVLCLEQCSILSSAFLSVCMYLYVFVCVSVYVFVYPCVCVNLSAPLPILQ